MGSPLLAAPHRRQSSVPQQQHSTWTLTAQLLGPAAALASESAQEFLLLLQRPLQPQLRLPMPARAPLPPMQAQALPPHSSCSSCAEAIEACGMPGKRQYSAGREHQAEMR